MKYYYVLTEGEYLWRDKKFIDNGFYKFYEKPLEFVKQVSTSVLHLLTINKIRYYDFLKKDRDEGKPHNCGINSMRIDLHCIKVFEYNEETDTCEFITQEILSIEGVKTLYQVTKDKEFYELLKIMFKSYEEEKFYSSEIVTFPQSQQEIFQQFPFQQNFYICCSYTHETITFGKIENLKEIPKRDKATYLFCKDINHIIKQQKYSRAVSPCDNCCWINEDDENGECEECLSCERESTVEVGYIDRINLENAFYIILSGAYGSYPNTLDFSYSRLDYYEGFSTFIDRARKRNKMIEGLNKPLYHTINAIIDDSIIEMERRQEREREEQRKREEQKKEKKKEEKEKLERKKVEFKKMLDDLK